MISEIPDSSVAATIFGAGRLLRTWADQINPNVKKTVCVPVTGEAKPAYGHLRRDDIHYDSFQPLDAPDRIPAGGVFEWRGNAVPYAIPRGR